MFLDTKMMLFKNYRSSPPEVFCKKGVLRNFAKFTGKHLCQRLFFNKIASLRPATTPVAASRITLNELPLTLYYLREMENNHGNLRPIRYLFRTCQTSIIELFCK